MKLNFHFLFALLVVPLGGCASEVGNFAINHAAPVIYDSMSCDQLSDEYKRLSAKVSGANSTSENSNNDSTFTKILKGLAEPAMYAVASANGADESVWQAMSSYEQVKSIAAQKQCPLQD